MEQYYNWEIQKEMAKQSKASKEKPGATASPAPRAPRQKAMGRGETLKLHLKKAASGHIWTPVPPQDKGPEVGKKHQESVGTGQAGRSPLMDEFLPLGEDVTNVLDYDDVQEDPEIAQAVANIPPQTDTADVEMQDEGVPLGTEPEFGSPG